MQSKLAQVYTRAHQGIDAPSVQVEAHLSQGLPALYCRATRSDSKRVKIAYAVLLSTAVLNTLMVASPLI